MSPRTRATRILVGLSTVVALVAAPSGVAAATGDPVATPSAATTTACTDGHWPAAVQGRPAKLEAGAPAGDYLWHDAAGWHLRVTHPGSSRVVFSGTIVSSAPLDSAPVKLEPNDAVTVSADGKTITYRFVNEGGLDGIDFTASCAERLAFGGRMDGVRLSPARIVIGHHDRHPLENPFVLRRVP